MRATDQPSPGGRGCILAAAGAALLLCAACSAPVPHSRAWNAGAQFATSEFSHFEGWVQSPRAWCTTAALARLPSPDVVAFAHASQFSAGCSAAMKAAGV